MRYPRIVENYTSKRSHELYFLESKENFEGLKLLKNKKTCWRKKHVFASKKWCFPFHIGDLRVPKQGIRYSSILDEVFGASTPLMWSGYSQQNKKTRSFINRFQVGFWKYHQEFEKYILKMFRIMFWQFFDIQQINSRTHFPLLSEINEIQ